MKAIIPAAGIGKRLQPHTYNRPKVMVPLAGKPILEHISISLFKAGFDEISVIVGYKKETIIDYFNKKYPGHFKFPVQEEMKGLGHAILYGLEDIDEPVLIILGDTIIDLDMSLLKGTDNNVIAVVEVEDPSRFGIVETNEQGKIIRMIEKPKNPQSNLAIAGAYYIQSQRKLKSAIETLIKHDIKTRNEYQLTDALVLMMENGEIFKALSIQAWYDCGTVETLLSTNRHLLSKGTEIKGKCINCKIIDPVYISEGAMITNSTIGPNAAIGEHVSVKGSSIDDSMINNGAEIIDSKLHNSIVGYGTKVSGYEGELNIGDEETLSTKQ
ncbi:MAG: NTP transferase domain-containing protein [Candidatus Marinimicrobia bacterium]|nr:NTP transferase domain-containing protein [Candidatus Neomarinimicrobiota bacterium]